MMSLAAPTDNLAHRSAHFARGGGAGCSPGLASGVRLELGETEMKYVLVIQDDWEISTAEVSVDAGGWVNPVDMALSEIVRLQFVTRPDGQCGGTHRDCWGDGIYDTREAAEEAASLLSSELAGLADIDHDGGMYRDDRHWLAKSLRRPFVDQHGTLHIDADQELPDGWEVNEDDGILEHDDGTFACRVHHAYRPGPAPYGDPSVRCVPADDLRVICRTQRDVNDCPSCGTQDWAALSHEEVRCNGCGLVRFTPDL